MKEESEKTFREIINNQYIELGKLGGKQEMLKELKEDGIITSEVYLAKLNLLIPVKINEKVEFKKIREEAGL